MKSLLRNLTKFVETTLELYAPLPFEFTADLHTLNAYLRSYSESEEKLLEGFVNRLVEKLEEKTRSLAVKETQPTSANESFDNALRHYSSCTFKYPELRLNLEGADELNITYNTLRDRQKPIYSQRTEKSQEGGIKANRHKFGSKHRNKFNHQDSERDITIDKENLSLNFNAFTIKGSSQDKSLKGIKSEVELLAIDANRKKSVDVILKEKKEEGKAKVRYESNESRNSNTSSLKIKLKPKPTIDLYKMKEGINLALELFSSQDEQIQQLMNSLIPPKESLVC